MIDSPTEIRYNSNFDLVSQSDFQLNSKLCKNFSGESKFIKSNNLNLKPIDFNTNRINSLNLSNDLNKDFSNEIGKEETIEIGGVKYDLYGKPILISYYYIIIIF